MFDSHLPLRQIILPLGPDDTRVELQISIEIPLLDCGFDIGQDITSAGVESLPARVGIERKCLVTAIRTDLLWGFPRGNIRRCERERHIARQGSGLPTKYHPHRSEPQRWCGRRYLAFRESDAGTCAP